MTTTLPLREELLCERPSPYGEGANRAMFEETVRIRRALQSSINETKTRTGMYFGVTAEMTTTLPLREELLCR